MKLALTLIGVLFAGTVQAHGPTPQKTDEFIQLGASPEAVWKKVIEPCSISNWNPEVTACDIVNDKQQSLTLKNGKKILQEIDEIAADEMTLSYRLSGEVDIAALPVSSLNGKIKVTPDASGAKVTWTARYYRAFTGNEPPAGQDDEAAKAAVDNFVKAGLNGLKSDKSVKNSTAEKSAQNASCGAALKSFLMHLG